MHRLALTTAAAVFLGCALLTLATLPAQAYNPWPFRLLFPPQAGQTTACLTCGWHGACTETPTPGTALDFGGTCSGSRDVYLRAYGFLPPYKPDTVVGHASYYIPDAWACKEVRARMHDLDGNYLGSMRYVHTENYWPLTIDLFANGTGGYKNEHYFVMMTTMDKPECIAQEYWKPPPADGVHVHEVALADGNSNIFLRGNGDCQDDCGAFPCASNQSGNCYYDPHDWWNSWAQGFCTTDEDCDFFKDAREQYIGTDPQDGCPDNSFDAAWPPDMNNDKTVKGADALYMRQTIGCMYGQACYNRRYDLDGSGTVQGLDAQFIRPFIGTQCS
jgi:hypothetical protein